MESEAFRIGNNAERRQSIISSMLAAGFDRRQAEAAAAEEGYAMGGRVGLEMGGMPEIGGGANEEAIAEMMMNMERLNEANGGRVSLGSGTGFDYRPGMPMDPLDPQRKISEVMDAYDTYYKGPGKKRRKIPFRRFFEIYAKENFADGGRVGFGEGTKIKLVEFIEKFKLENNRLPTIMEVADGAKSSTASIKKYLDEGVDFIKTDLSEVGKKGGDITGAKKKTGVTKLDKKAYKELQDLRIKGVSFQVDKGVGGSTGVRITIQNPEVRNAFLKGNKTKSVAADAKGINELKNLVKRIASSDRDWETYPFNS
jgi:hypothetical protein